MNTGGMDVISVCGKGFGGQGLLEGSEGPQGNVVVSDIPRCLIMNAGCTAGTVRWDRRGGAGAEEEENEEAEDEGEPHAGWRAQGRAVSAGDAECVDLVVNGQLAMKCRKSVMDAQ
jgi:hypothetical protein